MGEMIKVGMADLRVCAYPDSLTTLGLGSCIGIALYDGTTKITGLAHIMLPDSKRITRNENIAKFADTAIDETIRQMVEMGANRKKLVAKIAGGADMFSFGSSANSSFQVGKSNIAAVRENLARIGIPILAEDVGLNYGRTVIIRSEDGVFVIKSVGKPVKEI